MGGIVIPRTGEDPSILVNLETIFVKLRVRQIIKRFFHFLDVFKGDEVVHFFASFNIDHSLAALRVNSKNIESACIQFAVMKSLFTEKHL